MIQQNIMAAPKRGGVDLSREERYDKCSAIAQLLAQVLRRKKKRKKNKEERKKKRKAKARKRRESKEKKGGRTNGWM
jgi:hypothetical protein